MFSTFAVGGPQRRFATVARALDGFRHIIAAMDDNHAAANLLAGVDHELVKLSMTKGESVSIGNLIRLRTLYVAERPDRLCTYNWGSIEAVIANRLTLAGEIVPHLHFEDGFGPDESQNHQLARRVRMRRLLLGKTRVIVPSHTLERIAVASWGLRNVQLVYNGIDTELFHPAETGTRKKIVIGTIGALRPEKNFSMLLAAFAKSELTNRARLVIAGDGPEKEKLHRLADSLGISGSVNFPGHVTDPAALYRTFDLFAMTSDTEQMPLSLLEAMASGLPVVATDVGDVAAMLSDDNSGFVVPRGNEAGLAALLHQCCDDVVLRQRLGKANRAKVLRRYQLQQMIDAYGQLFSGKDVA
ncbi:glycosyltransferase [Aquisalinus flavus]|uniref:glycosyltransferase n=1 Tax=Aquisalinus flavus TaxID=1526572 RepID=UPI00165F013F|nr:glycosyltransferase [Aquisalinus flavus]MBD0427598.1 glycosyltransferase [Aquisalinus flavus]